MTRSREVQVDVSSTPYYHVYSRCVRQAYLFDSDLGIDHKQLFVDRIKSLASVFCIDIAAYAVMSNHYHLVVHIDSKRAKQLDEKIVAKRWLRLFKNPIAKSWLAGEKLSETESLRLDAYLVQWRERLSDLSWFMRCLNEHIARKVNELEDTRGRFWESRFKSKALLDEAALLTCMQYVDLNPIRAKTLTRTLESSDYTAIQDRLIAHRKSQQHTLPTKLEARANTLKLTQSYEVKGLMPFAKPPKRVQQDLHASPSSNPPKHSLKPTLPFYRDDYFELIEWTGKAILPGKAGHIPENLQPILQRLNLNSEHWLETIKEFDDFFTQAVGEERAVKTYCKRITNASKRRHGDSYERFSWFKGMKQLRKLYKVF